MTEQPTASARLSDRLSFHLRLAHETAQQRFTVALSDIGLAPAHADVLALVGDHPGIKPSELADTLVRDRSSITAALHVLDQRGLIRRQTTTRDRRATLLHLTDAGQDALRTIAAIAAAHDSLLDRIVGEDDKLRFIEALRRIRGALEQGGPSR